MGECGRQWGRGDGVGAERPPDQGRPRLFREGTYRASLVPES